MASIDLKEKNDAFDSQMEKKQPSTTQTGAKTRPSSQKQQFKCEEATTSLEQGKRQRTIHKTINPGLQNPKDSTGCHEKCVSDGQDHDGITERVGSHIMISEMISGILDGISNLYIAINDVKSYIYDNNHTIYNNLKMKNLSLSQINEAHMCFEKFLGKIKTSDNDSSFGNKINEKSAITKELTDKYSKLNIDDVIETILK
ncbi:hypothetical protein O181_105437 [Austropuccinia psidii MF-1]|uniref:Uncharacterized protein n=1 Tax=Austropuccinia psidii MF-1 TaxID=1389203 RepID=A0A9Q3JNI4_9BASI|nr:hypothetical protein [Austropuccinia psidii MF-1]